MGRTLKGVAPVRLERSCSTGADSIRFGPSAPGIERAQVYLSTRAFAPHQHGTYGIGITTAGVQTFRYRGARRVCLPGQLHVLHPDETHDGAAGTDDGFGYWIIHIAPELVRDALGGGPLPFITDPVPRPTLAAQRVTILLAEVEEPISELTRTEIAIGVADALVSLTGRSERHSETIDLRAVELVRDYLSAHPREQTPASTLEKIAGLDRFTITRHFRWAFGTSPDRYRTLRRLALARAAIQARQPLARVAAESGFADQSHMTRQFKRTYGMTPARWVALTATASAQGRPRTTSRRHGSAP